MSKWTNTEPRSGAVVRMIAGTHESTLRLFGLPPAVLHQHNSAGQVGRLHNL